MALVSLDLLTVVPLYRWISGYTAGNSKKYIFKHASLQLELKPETNMGGALRVILPVRNYYPSLALQKQRVELGEIDKELAIKLRNKRQGESENKKGQTE